MPEAAPTPAASGSGARVYEWKGRTGPFGIQVPPEVFTPSRTSLILADALEIRPGDTVLDVGCGSGALSLVAARLGAARAVGCDSSPAAVRSARANARLLGLAAVTEFRAGHLLEPVRDLAADVVIADVSGVVDQIDDGQWDMPMPPVFARRDSSHVPTLREIINYHAYDDAWVPDMLAGRTMAGPVRVPAGAA